MCGILGVLGGDFEKNGELARTRALPRLRHRGPDETQLCLHKKENLILGHTRLRILDLSKGGRQPMYSADGRHGLVYNGEIYNFLEIRAALEAEGISFRTEGDTEVFLAAFVRWGPACFSKFNGMWAAGIFNFTEQRLFLSRDRFGKKPLFWARMPEGFVFASEMKGILPFLPNPKINRTLLRNTRGLTLYESTEDCLIEEIRRFPAGCWAEVKESVVQANPYWRTLEHLPAVPRRYEEQVEQVRELFLDSCRLRMRSDVPIGTALSGGLDSSATLAVMSHCGKQSSRRQAQSWQNAFTASFPGSFLDETPYARELCQALGIPFHPVLLSGERALQNLPEDMWKFEEIYLAAPSPFMAVYQSIREAGTVVTLDGHGADELFGGYAFDYLEAVYDAGKDVPAALAILKTWESQWPPETEEFKLPYRNRFQHLARLWIRRWRNRVQGKISPIEPGTEQLPDELARKLFVSTHRTILPTLLRNYDRYSMAYGVEIRMPFMDHRLVSLAMALPWTSKIRNGYSKAVLRDAVAPYLPDSIAYRKIKFGFSPPANQWMRGPWKEFLMDMTTSRDFQSCEFIDQTQAVRSLYKALASPNFRDAEDAWVKIVPYLWQKYFWENHCAGKN